MKWVKCRVWVSTCSGGGDDFGFAARPITLGCVRCHGNRVRGLGKKSGDHSLLLNGNSMMPKMPRQLYLETPSSSPLADTDHKPSNKPHTPQRLTIYKPLIKPSDTFFFHIYIILHIQTITPKGFEKLFLWEALPSHKKKNQSSSTMGVNLFALHQWINVFMRTFFFFFF